MRLNYLDGLRGYAALTVVLGHAQMFYPGFMQYRTSLNPLWLRYLFNALVFPLEAGTFSVYIFFVLSGFVIAASASKSETPLALIAVNRYLRLTLPMVVTALAAWFLIRLFPHATLAPAKISQADWIGSIYRTGPVKLPSALRDAGWDIYLKGISYIDPVLWTMRVELIGSLSVYALYAVAKPSARPQILAVAGLVCANQAGRYLGFVLGTAFYEVYDRGLLKPNERWWPLPLAAGLLGGAFGQWNPIWPWLQQLAKAGVLDDEPIAVLWSLSAALVVASLLTSRPFQRFMSSQVFQPLGRISFSLYLIHMPLLGTLLSWSYAVLLPHHSTAEIIVWEASFLAISLLAATVMTAAIDEPVISLVARLKKIRPLTARIWSRAEAR